MCDGYLGALEFDQCVDDGLDGTEGEVVAAVAPGGGVGGVGAQKQVQVVQHAVQVQLLHRLRQPANHLPQALPH